ncbi:reverse transcriptase domain-containing protein [Zunongwangia sp. HRR-M8]|uniref:reverse transcriptase domain-containing protein n=1 Tax=Zunongwangia sp. HRR-M8 TaxID=3015170 RepID=UPI0022DD47B3|nr:reverse transcriptase domain-containing protein [Zunongwangia sp. HRR-M8]WBL22310.1 reverse transcriptase domain-containing protein [Zunongwangia sp. HRR-M8]
MTSKDWFKLKKYPHIGLPFERKDRNWLIAYVTNPDKISKHRFVPLIKREIIQRKYRPEGFAKNDFGKRIRKKQEPKKRHIYYASHLESLIYSYYSNLLTDHYEKFLEDKPYRYCPVAYRRIPKVLGEKGNKSNIEFAKEAFEFIKENNNKSVSVIVADVTSFFDNLDHKILHAQWKRVLNKRDASGNLKMPNDHYNVYKSLVNKRYVKQNELHNTFFNKVWVERGTLNDPQKKILKQKRVNKTRNLKREKVVAYCTKREFFNNHVALIRPGKKCSQQHKKCRNNCEPGVMSGIPQGTPMSATLANIYMLDFDELMSDAVSEIGGFYQRYSDDLIIICNQADENKIKHVMINGITKLCKLGIQEKKTQTYRYSNNKGVFTGGIVSAEGDLNKNKQLEYLGFEYTGGKVYIKTNGFSKFYRGMVRSIKRGKFYASKKHNKSKGVFKNRLYKRFTIIGGKRRLRRIPDPERPNMFIKDPVKTYDWGNYFSYVLKANDVFRTLNGGKDIIKRQSRKIEINFHRALKHPRTELKPRKIKKKDKQD